MFDQLAAEIKQFREEGVTLTHEFDPITLVQIFVVIFLALLLPLIIFSQIPKK